MAKRETRTGGRDATDAVVPGKYALSIGAPPTQPPNGFAWRKLTDIARLESGHTPSRARPEYWDGGIPWIGIKDATGNHGRAIPDTLQHVSQLGIDNSSARILPAGTVCLSRTASVGYVVIMGVPMATSQDFVNWVCGPELSPQYLRYVLMVEQDSIRRFAYGTTHQTLYYPDAKALHVSLPTRVVQDSIVAVLGAIDDKVIVNLCLIGTADATTDAIVASSTEPTASTPLDSLAVLTMGSSPPGSALNENGGGLPFFQGIRDFGLRTPMDRVRTTEPVRTANRGDILVSVRAPVGTVNFAPGPCSIGRGVAAARSTTGTPYTLFHLLRRSTAWAPYNSEGTVFGSINRPQLAALRVPSITAGNAAAVEARIAPVEQRITSALDENKSLIELRDTLLPQLISGRLRVKDAEKQVEDAV